MIEEGGNSLLYFLCDVKDNDCLVYFTGCYLYFTSFTTIVICSVPLLQIGCSGWKCVRCLPSVQESEGRSGPGDGEQGRRSAGDEEEAQCQSLPHDPRPSHAGQWSLTIPFKAYTINWFLVHD